MHRVVICNNSWTKNKLLCRCASWNMTMTMTLDSIPLRLWCGGAIARCLVLQRSQVRPHYTSVLQVGPKILWENVRNILLSRIPQAVCISLEAYWLEGPVGGLLPALLEALHRLNYLILFRGAVHQFSRFLPVTCLQYASPFTPPEKIPSWQ